MALLDLNKDGKQGKNVSKNPLVTCVYLGYCRKIVRTQNMYVFSAHSEWDLGLIYSMNGSKLNIRLVL